MTRFILIRLAQTLIALLGILVLIFFTARLSGDPTNLLVSPTSTPEQMAQIRHNLGLDRSVGLQFVIYLKDLASGNMGESFFRYTSVVELIKESMPNTLKLTVPAFVLAMALALSLGILAAARRDSIFDNGVKFLAVLGQALPGFWVAIMAVLLFAVTLHWVPVAGSTRPSNYILPIATQMFFIIPGMMRLVRSSMLDVLNSEYIKLARIKGLPERVVIWKHALRNALIAPLTVAGMLLGGLISGALITENIFNWPGTGRLILQATVSRDFPVVQGLTLLIATMVLGMNLIVDIVYAYIDPQMRYGRS